ncbi:MAG TPA: sigma-70 family RNA polymerase sigma factor [Solirubrobacteraceae bacterium]|jgi:RNA polymerase sigma-70 factor (ECF subfamily)
MSQPDRRLIDDEQLMARAACGNRRAFEVLFDRHADLAFSLAYRICRRRAMAEDVVQEAFLSMWRGADRYERARGSVRSWTLSIVHSRAIDALRRAKLRDGVDIDDLQLPEPATDDGLVEAEVLRREDTRQIREALGALPPEQRQVIELAYLCGLTHTEIASALGLPAGTVKGRIRLGLERLRRALDTGPAIVAARA